MEQIPLYKRKTFYLPLIAVLTIGMAVAAGVYISHISTTITVSEAISTTSTELSFAGYAAETHTQTVSLHNAASVAENVSLGWTQTNNPSDVVYSTNLPQTVTIDAGADLTVDVTVTVASDSPNGTVEGTVDVARV